LKSQSNTLRFMFFFYEKNLSNVYIYAFYCFQVLHLIISNSNSHDIGVTMFLMRSLLRFFLLACAKPSVMVFTFVQNFFPIQQLTLSLNLKLHFVLSSHVFSLQKINK